MVTFRDRDRRSLNARDPGEDAFEQWRHRAKLLEANHAVPQAFELLPSCRIEEVLGVMFQRCRATASRARSMTSDRTRDTPSRSRPSRRAASAPPADRRRAACRRGPSSASSNAPATAISEYNWVPGYGVRMWNVAVVMPLLDGPVHRSREHVRIVAVHAEHEAAVDHDAEVVEPLRDGAIVAPEVLALAGALRDRRSRQAFRSRQTGCAARRPRPVRSGRRGGSNRRWRRPGRARPMPRMPVEQRRARSGGCRADDRRESRGGGRATVEFRRARRRRAGCRRNARLRRTRPCSRSRSDADSRASHDDRVGHQVAMAVDQIAPDRRNAFERAARGRDDNGCAARRRARSLRNRGKCLLAGSEEDGVRVRRGLVGKGRDVQPARERRSAPLRR